MSNSGYEACHITAAGVRKDGVSTVVEIVRNNSGLDGFSIAWLYAGGAIQNGRLVGVCNALTVDRFAAVLSMQKRIKDAELQDKIEGCPSVVVRLRDGKPIKAQGYKLKGAVNPKKPYYSKLLGSDSAQSSIPQPAPVSVSAEVASRYVSDLQALLD